MASIDDALRTTLELTTKKLDDLNKKITTVDGTIRKLSESFEKLPAIKDVEFRVKVTGEAAAKQAINKLASKNTIELNVTTNTEKATRDVGQLRQEIQQLHRAWAEALQAQQKVHDQIEAGTLRGSAPLKQTKQTQEEVNNVQVLLKARREELLLAQQLQVENEKRLATERAIAEGKARDTALSFTRNQETALANGRAVRAQAEEQQREIQRQRQQQANQFANPPAGSVVRNLAAEHENNLYAAQQRFRNDPFNQPTSAGTVRIGPAELSAKEQALRKLQAAEAQSRFVNEHADFTKQGGAGFQHIDLARGESLGSQQASFQEFKANIQREAELEEIFGGRVKKTSGAIKQVINALESEVGGAKLARSEADLAQDKVAFSKFDEVVRRGERRIDLLRERLQTVERSEASQLSPQQKVSRINRDLLFLQGEDLENFDLIRAQKAAKAGVNVSALRGKPGTFEPGRLTNPETLIQLGFAGAFGGLPSLLGGVIGGSTPLGPGGALLGSTIAQAAGDILFAKPISALKEKQEEFQEAGLAYQRSILGISAILQENTNLGGLPSFPAQLSARSAQATEIQLAARKQLLPLGIGGQTESTFVQGIVSALSQRGLQATPEQVAVIARNIGGAIQAQRPALLENTQQLLKDIQDVIGGGPNASRTVLSQIIRPALGGLQRGRSTEELVAATEVLSPLAETAKNLENPITVINKLNGVLDTLKTNAGNAVLEALVPAFKQLADVLKDESVQKAIVEISKAFAELSAAGLKLTAGAIAAIAPPLSGFIKGLKELSPALIEAGLALAGLAAIGKGVSLVGGVGRGAAGAATTALGRKVAQETEALAAGGAIRAAEENLAKAGGSAVGTAAPSIASKLAGSFQTLAKGLLTRAIGILGGPVGIALAILGAVQLAATATDLLTEARESENEALTESIKSRILARRATPQQKAQSSFEASLGRVGLKEEIEKAAGAVPIANQIAGLEEALNGKGVSEVDVSSRIAARDKLEEFRASEFQAKLGSQFNLNTVGGKLSAAEATRTELLPQTLSDERKTLADIKDAIAKTETPEGRAKLAEAADKRLRELEVERAKIRTDFDKLNRKGTETPELLYAREDLKDKDKELLEAREAAKKVRTNLESGAEELKLKNVGLEHERKIEAIRQQGLELVKTEQVLLKDRFTKLIAPTIDQSTAQGAARFQAENQANIQQVQIKAIEQFNLAKKSEEREDVKSNLRIIAQEGFKSEAALLETAVKRVAEEGQSIDRSGFGGGTSAAQNRLLQIDIQRQNTARELATAQQRLTAARQAAPGTADSTLVGTLEDQVRKLRLGGASLGPAQAEAQRQAAQSRLGEVGELENLKASNVSLANSAASAAERLQAMGDAVAQSTRSLEDFNKEGELRSLGAQGQRLGAAQKFLAAGGSTSSLDAETANILTNPDSFKAFQLKQSQLELEDVERKTDPGRLRDQDYETRRALTSGVNGAQRELNAAPAQIQQQQVQQLSSGLAEFIKLQGAGFEKLPAQLQQLLTENAKGQFTQLQSLAGADFGNGSNIGIAPDLTFDQFLKGGAIGTDKTALDTLKAQALAEPDNAKKRVEDKDDTVKDKIATAIDTSSTAQVQELKKANETLNSINDAVGGKPSSGADQTAGTPEKKKRLDAVNAQIKTLEKERASVDAGTTVASSLGLEGNAEIGESKRGKLDQQLASLYGERQKLRTSGEQELRASGEQDYDGIAGPELGPDGLPKRHILPGLDPEYDKKYAQLKRDGFRKRLILPGLDPEYDKKYSAQGLNQDLPAPEKTSEEQKADKTTETPASQVLGIGLLGGERAGTGQSPAASFETREEYRVLKARYDAISEGRANEGTTPQISALIDDYSKDLETYKSHLGPQTSGSAGEIAGGSAGAGVLGASAGTSTDPAAPAVDTQTQILQMLTRIATAVEKRGGITADEMRGVMESAFT